MKILTSLFCVLLFFSCSTSKEYEVENQQYNCLKENYQSEENVNLDKLILDFENKLIEQEILKDHSSASFFKCLQAMAEADRKPISLMPSALSQSILSSQRYALLCQKDIDNRLLADSRILEVQKGIQDVFTEIERVGDINPQGIGEGLVKVFKQEDFGHSLYRLNAFLVIGFLAEYESKSQNRGITKRLNKVSIAPISDQWQMNVLINKQNKILIEGKEVSFDEFSDKVDQLFTQSRTESKQSKRIKDRGNYALGRAFISLRNEKGTDYDFYLKVYKELENSYTKLWDSLAVKVFNQSFDQLNKKEQKSIKELQPWMVSESEPVDD